MRARSDFHDAVNLHHADPRLAAGAVYDRLKEAMGLTSGADLAWRMGVSPQSLGNKKRRNSVPYREAIFVAEKTGSSLEYLLTGTGTLTHRTAGKW